MSDKDNVVNPPPEASDPALSSAEKDAFFANDPNGPKLPEEEAVVHPAHPVEEDPEKHIGRKTKDPWADPKQTDWADNDELLSEPEEGGVN